MEEKQGKSWKNMREVNTITTLVRRYYKKKDFCIITPYDGQRSALQKALKDLHLPWENVFNVDSFQGNEAPYVLVSVVRTKGPGFLKSQNRVNVMLTRCKAGMVIVSNRAFMRQNTVKKTLLGYLVTYWEEKVGKSNAWCDWRDVSDLRASLPDAHGKNATDSANTTPSLAVDMNSLSLS
ncbi:AAA domain-containing protein [Phellopilus nigrolimitatus]|nr:AAA domain-containing protein [Phellopilus nigrolimitatus]